MKKLAIAIMLGLGVMVSGCGNNQLPTQQQTVQQNEGISLSKAIDLQRKGQFTPQKVQFQWWSNDVVFGDEPEIVLHSQFQLDNKRTTIHIHVKDRNVIKNLANYQKEHNTQYTRGVNAIDVNEITFDGFKYDVK